MEEQITLHIDRESAINRVGQSYTEYKSIHFTWQWLNLILKSVSSIWVVRPPLLWEMSSYSRLLFIIHLTECQAGPETNSSRRPTELPSFLNCSTTTGQKISRFVQPKWNRKFFVRCNNQAIKKTVVFFYIKNTVKVTMQVEALLL